MKKELKNIHNGEVWIPARIIKKLLKTNGWVYFCVYDNKYYINGKEIK